MAPKAVQITYSNSPGPHTLDFYCLLVREVWETLICLCMHQNTLSSIHYTHESIFVYMYYRVSHSKVNKVILLRWGYRFWFLLIFCVLLVHEIGPFMHNLPVFIEMMLHTIYGQIRKCLLFFSEFSIISNFRTIPSNEKGNKPSKCLYIRHKWPYLMNN